MRVLDRSGGWGILTAFFTKEDDVNETVPLRPAPVPARVAKVIVVANARAGLDTPQGRENDALISVIEERFVLPGSAVRADLEVIRTADLDDLAAAKMRVLEIRPHYLFVFGGDGTIQRLFGSDDDFLERLYETGQGPMIAFLGGGSTNTIRGELKVLGRDRFNAVTRLIDKIRAGVGPDLIYRSVLRIIAKDGRVFHGFIYGSGAAARFLEKYNAKSPKGVRRAAIVILAILWREFIRLFWWKKKSIAEKTPLSYQYYRDSSRVPSPARHMRASGVVMSTLAQVGLGCRLTYRATERVQHCHAVISGLGFWTMVMNLPWMYLPADPWGNVRSEVVSRVVFRYEAPVLHTIDGELYASEDLGETVTIETGPYLPIIRA